MHAARCTTVRIDELTTIGDYEVRVIGRVGSVVRYQATHVVLPRRAVVEMVELDAPRADAMRLMRRACILEALQHPAVPRVYECGRLDGRPWIATSHEHDATLADELQHRRLEVREALTLLEDVGAFLSHAHARGVLHGNIAPNAIVRAPTLRLLRWENARLHDTELLSDAIDGREDVFALGKTISSALAKPSAAPEALKRLLVRMLSPDPAGRPTASEVVSAVRAMLDVIGSIDRVLEAFASDAELAIPETVIELDDSNDDCILLERRHIKSVMVDLDARA